MPYRRRYTQGRGQRKSYRGRKKRYMRRSNRMTSYRVRRIINAELKSRVIAIALNDIPQGAGLVIPITSGIGQGTQSNQRIGNWIKPVNLHGAVVIHGNFAAPETLFNVRCGFISWYNDEQFDPPDLVQIVEDPLAPFGPLSISNRGSFKQVWARKYIVANNNDSSKFMQNIPYYIKLRLPKCTYDAGNPKKFQLFFYIHSDSLAANQPQFSFDFTFRYTDS